jgi:Uncharacterized conserved protein
MLLRERETPEGTLVSVCDADCLGETYDNGRATLTVTEGFYAGPDAVEAGPEEVVAALRRAQSGTSSARSGRHRGRGGHRRRGDRPRVRRDATRPIALVVARIRGTKFFI